MFEEEYNRSKSQQPVGTAVPNNLQERVQHYCWENNVKRKQEWESHRMALERMKESKEEEQQQSQRNEMQCMLKCYKTSNELGLL